VFQSEPNTWLVTRYDDIRAMSRDPARFSSERGVLINDPARGPGAPNIQGSILHMDPPAHADYRKLLNREFTPRAVGRLEPRVREIVTGVLDTVPGGEVLDFVERVAVAIPVLVIAELLGVGDGDLADFHRWSDAVMEVTDEPTPEIMTATMELFAFLNEHIAARQAQRAEDLISILVASDVSPGDLVMFCLTLLVAGNETTRHLISGGTEALAHHPDQRAALTAAPEGIGIAVEEMLRWVTPIQAFGRTATVDLELGGAQIPAGDFLVMLYASGNRDEAAFGPTADRFDAARPVDTSHVAFGFGEHLCLGAALARLEARVVFEELLARFPHYELAGDTERAPSTLVRGARRMPVVLR
jgi:cytochrome P450